MKILRNLFQSALFLVCTADVTAYVTDFQMYGGCRRDYISTKIDSYNTEGLLLLTDSLKAKDIKIKEWGSKGAVILGPMLLKGNSAYGKVTDGKYTDKVEVLDTASLTHAEINRGHTRDVSFGVGYLMSCFFIKGGPVAGWSYHNQDIKMKNAITDENPEPALDGLRYKTRWNGPWAGMDFLLCLGIFQAAVSYEYHWAHWRGKWLLEGPDVFGGSYSDKRRSNHGHGQAFKLDLYYFYCPGTYGSVNFSVSSWQAKNGSEVTLNGTFASIGLPEVGQDKIPHAAWISYSLTFGLGSAF